MPLPPLPALSRHAWRRHQSDPDQSGNETSRARQRRTAFASVPLGYRRRDTRARDVAELRFVTVVRRGRRISRNLFDASLPVVILQASWLARVIYRRICIEYLHGRYLEAQGKQTSAERQLAPAHLVTNHKWIGPGLQATGG